MHIAIERKFLNFLRAINIRIIASTRIVILRRRRYCLRDNMYLRSYDCITVAHLFHYLLR